MYKPYKYEQKGSPEERRVVAGLNRELRVYKTHFEARNGYLPEGVENFWARERLSRAKKDHPKAAIRIEWAPRSCVVGNGDKVPNPDYGFLLR